MQTRSPIARIVATLFAALMAVTAAASAHAQETSYSATFQHNTEAIPVNVLVGQSRVINFDHAIGRFSVSNPEIAEAVLVAPDQVLVNGKAFGQVNFIAWEQTGGKFLVFDVFVRTNLSLIDSQIRVLFPKENISLSQANGSVVISGSVANEKTVAQVQSVVEAAGFKTVNMLSSPVKSATQIQLQVRVAEVSRSKMRDLAFSPVYQSSPGHGAYTNTGSGPYTVGSVEGGSIFGSVASTLNVYTMAGNAFLFLRALQTQGALRELAEPNLIAMDGQQASFLAGGEFPVPIVQGGGNGNGAAVSIMFKEYGVRLNFKPTIIDEDHIRLELEPEVSTIDFGNGVKFNGFLIPALKTRRAKTGVELRDGQSFALAGLLDNSETKSLSKIPVLGDVPILGALFRSKNFQSNETELMFIVTAQVVKPVNRDDLPQMRGIDGLKTGSPLGIEPKGEGIQGQSGFSTGGTSQNVPQSAPHAAPAPTAAPAAPATQPTRTVPVTLPSASTSVSFLPDNLPRASLNARGGMSLKMDMEMVPPPK
ncbi:MAG TPA: type II and III secretion system protein family protein [Pyrinomonadaceae bacterium]|jgi:pilus assembly protein CpaC|nr:type II and III secretion system protein family protein [Pyrinomonadaceae bacterium]